MAIDVDTLVLLELLTGVELTLMLLLVGRLLHGEAGLRPWVLALASATAGNLVATLAGGIAGASVLAALLLSLGPALVWLGARDYCGRRRSLLPVGASSALVGVVGLVVPGATSEAWAVSLSAALWSAAVVWTLVRHTPLAQRTGTLLLALLVALHGAFQVARLFFPAAEEWNESVVAMGSIFFTVAWTFAVMGLISQRLVGKMRDAARTDGLTGALNRRAFIEDGALALEFCRRRSRPCAVIMADLDHFKRLNDTQGHAAGDAALRCFAAAVARAAGQGTVVGRYGGEEFGLVFPGADAAVARDWAEKLRAELAARASFTVSFGLAVGTGSRQDFMELVARADEALYRAKAAGRDRVCE